MGYTIRSMTIEDHDIVVELWRSTEGIELTDTDEREPMGRFLDRNPGLSLVAECNRQLVGAVLCSHDGRRGYMHHLAVEKDHRRQGIGSRLVQEALSLLRREGIVKCNIFILEFNKTGIGFWERNGFCALAHFGWMQAATSSATSPVGEV
jgi:putative acetyltransferase